MKTTGLNTRALANVVVLAFCLWLLPAQAAREVEADIVLRNGKIYTADAKRSIAQAIAFTRNTIFAIGNNEDMVPLIGARTKIVDLKGKLVLPGLIDTHIHPIFGAVDRLKCSLADLEATITALKPVIQACLAKDSGGTHNWLEAVQLDNYGFSATALDLDNIESARPLVLEGNDGHTVWVNSRGLGLTGVTAASLDPPGGKIVRDASGTATGAFFDNATALVLDKISQPSVEERAALTAAELKSMSAFGITSLMDAYVTPAEAAVWRRLYETGKLSMRVRTAIYVADPNDDSDESVASLVAESKAGDIDPDFLRAGVVKVFADGVMEYPAQTAALLSPYLDSEGKPTENAGKLYFDPQRFARLVAKLDGVGLTVHIHAIGDRAVRASLDAFAYARGANGKQDNRHQIAHLQLVDPADFSRFKELDVIGDMQLEWAARDASLGAPLEPYLGPERYRYLYPAGSLHAAGALIVGGSDWDVSSYNPFRAMQHAVTRTERGTGHGPLNIDERIPLETAIEAYTINAAFALKQDVTTGSLEVGKRADLVVLDRDILSVEPETIEDTVVLATYLDGCLVYSAKANGDRWEDQDSCIRGRLLRN
jgi:predicted amidohydrolase YtcJ